MTDLLLSQIAFTLSIAAKRLLETLADAGGKDQVLRLNGAPFELMGKRLIQQDGAASSSSWQGYTVELTALGKALVEEIRKEGS